MKIDVSVLIRVADTTTDTDINLLEDGLHDQENESDDGDTEYIYEAITKHLSHVEKKVKLIGDYSISRNIIVKRESDVS